MKAGFENFCERFYGWEAVFAGRLSNFFKPARVSPWASKYLKKPVSLLTLELFVAVSLAIYYFIFMLYGCSGKYVESENTYSNTQIFTYLSHHPVSTNLWFLDKYPDWKTRLPGPILTGWMTDRAWDFCEHRNFAPEACTFGIGGWRFSAFRCTFAAYHACWLLALFCLLSLYRRDALLVTVGTFAGLMFAVTNIGGYRSHDPWDMPTMFFFTWAILMYDSSKRMLPLAAVICLGALFRETAMICALLILLGEHWPLRKRIAGFVGTLAVYLGAKKVLLLTYAVPVNVSSWENFHSGIRLLDNFSAVFVRHELNSPLFANAGALLIMLLLPWQTRRDLLFKLVAVVFVISMAVFGTATEYRIWYDVLPLGWMMVSECISRHSPGRADNPAGPGRARGEAMARERESRVRKGAYGLTMASLGIACLCLCVLAHFTRLWPERDLRTLGAAKPATADSDPDALNEVALMLAISGRPEVRDGALAVEAAERACKRTDYKKAKFLGTLALAYAEAGRFDEAISLGEKVSAMAAKNGETELLELNQYLLGLYRMHQPYHDPPPSPPRPSDAFYD